MPWDNDTTFTYTPSTVHHALSSFTALQELAVDDLYSQAACTYYDLLRAMDGIRMDQWEYEAFMLSLDGHDDAEIGLIMNYTYVSVGQKLRRIRRQIRDFLVPPAPKEDTRE